MGLGDGGSTSMHRSMTRIWAKGTTAAHPGDHYGNQNDADRRLVLEGDMWGCAADPNLFLILADPPSHTLSHQLGSESTDRNWDYCEDIAVVLTLGPRIAAASAGISSVPSQTLPSALAADKASDDKFPPLRRHHQVRPHRLVARRYRFGQELMPSGLTDVIFSISAERNWWDGCPCGTMRRAPSL